ncbi:MAG: LysR family transcriptional regulator [Actinobacteria bacterium]|nr:LysR family transcriptional regulator [Actinomycetota bacterium]
MINFNQLRAFHEAARLQSFSAAARALHVTQPAITSHVRALEASLGVRLFRRRGRRMVLTETGALLFLQSREVFELERTMERTVAEVRSLERGVLRVGTTKTYSRHLMPSLTTQFHASHPGVRMVLDEGTSLDMCRSLLDLRNELAIVARVEGQPGVTFVPFREEKVVLVAAPAHPFAVRGSILFRELEGLPIITREEGSGVQTLTRACFDARGMTPDVVVETGNVEFIKEMVESGEALSFLVGSAVADDLALGRLVAVRIDDQDLTLDVNIAYLDEDTLSPAAAAFLELLLVEK